MSEEALVVLGEALSQVGVVAEEQELRAVLRHLELVAEWNERINLTAITDAREMVVKHAVDSATALGMLNLDPGVNVIDVGSGAGFPGVTLKCLVPEVNVVLLESLGKRCRFLEEVWRELGPILGSNTAPYEVVWARAEEKGQDPSFRERFDVAVARAVADLRVLAEYCLPFCRPGGVFLALKGPSVQDELEASGRAIEVLGGRLEEVRRIELPYGAGSRTLVKIQKVGSTPATYPRKPGTPAKRPL